MRTVSVNMVDVMPIRDGAVRLLPNPAMFPDSTAHWQCDAHIPIGMDQSASFPVRMVLGNLTLCSACGRTVVSLVSPGVSRLAFMGSATRITYEGDSLTGHRSLSLLMMDDAIRQRAELIYQQIGLRTVTRPVCPSEIANRVCPTARNRDNVIQCSDGPRERSTTQIAGFRLSEGATQLSGAQSAPTLPESSGEIDPRHHVSGQWCTVPLRTLLAVVAGGSIRSGSGREVFNGLCVATPHTSMRDDAILCLHLKDQSLRCRAGGCHKHRSGFPRPQANFTKDWRWSP